MLDVNRIKIPVNHTEYDLHMHNFKLDMSLQRSFLPAGETLTKSKICGIWVQQNDSTVIFGNLMGQ